MATLRQMMGNVKVLLNEPLPQRPSPLRLLTAITQNTQNLYNHISNTGKAWDVRELVFSVGSEQESVQLQVGDEFGKPLSVYTVDSGNPSHIEREVDFYELQNLNYDWSRPNDIGRSISNTDGSSHSAERVAFYRSSGGIYARVKPSGGDTVAEYKVIYSVGNWIESASINSSPILSNHHHLIEIRSAKSVLPSCQWWPEEKENRIRRAELSKTLSEDEAMAAALFDKYVQSIRKDKISFRQGVSFD